MPDRWWTAVRSPAIDKGPVTMNAVETPCQPSPGILVRTTDGGPLRQYPRTATRSAGATRAAAPVPPAHLEELSVPRRDADPNFVEAVARGLDVIRAFGPNQPVMTLTQVATAAELARPTAHRILATLEALGYVRACPGGFALTPRVLDLGMTYVQAMGLWDVARPHLERLVARTGESSSIAQLDGGDIVYVARVAVPKIIALAVSIGTRFPAPATSLGKVLLAGLGREELDHALAEPSRSGVTARRQPDAEELTATLREVRATGWALTDEQLAPGIRSIAAPLRDGDGRVVAAVNVTVHAAETPLATLTDTYLPLLLQAAGAISADFARLSALPATTQGPAVIMHS